MLSFSQYLRSIIKFVIATCPLWLTIFILNSAIAQPNSTADLGEVVSVDQLSKISPTDWRLQQLNQLAQRTECLSTDYRQSDAYMRTSPLLLSKLNGRKDLSASDPRNVSSRFGYASANRTITRVEFAVGLKQCLDLLKLGNLTIEEISFIARMERDFASELLALGQRVDNLEARTDKLEAQRFSTTTKLNGEILFQLGDSFSSEDDSQLFTGYRARLNFDTSFYGEDRLRVRLQARNTGELEEVEDTFMVRLGVDGESENEIETEVSYNFVIGEQIQGVVGVNSVGADDVAEVLNPLSSSGQGAVSRFARRNPATLRGAGGTGAGIQYELNGSLQISLGYFADGDDAANPSDSAGLFGASYSGVLQLKVEPVEDLEVALTYTRSYYREGEARLMGATGSENANEPFEEDSTSSDNFGFQANWKVSDRLELGGWFGYTIANSEIDDESATILNTAFTLALLDLGREGSEGGIIIGIPPIVTQHDNSEIEDERTSLHLEAFYRYQINDNIAITPGIFWITQPDHSASDSIWVGTVRTRFSF
ncbi:MAG: iron uptake porin [Cyanobacteria bacterium P01_A01_bin.83]